MNIRDMEISEAMCMLRCIVMRSAHARKKSDKESVLTPQPAG